MISSTEALNIILDQNFSLETELIDLEFCSGRVLAEAVFADRDFPPFDRVCMDGIALRYSAYANGTRRFKLEATQLAGQAAANLTNENGCIEIMTGAMLPDGTDTIVPVEHVQKIGDMYELLEPVKEGRHIHERATDRPKGDELIQANTVIGPKEIAVLATIGASKVKVYKRPSIAVISTGDELVHVDEQPLAHQIRMSNSHMLRAQLIKLGWEASLFHMPDNKETLRQKLKEVFQTYKIVLFTGGVSKGKADYVPEILEELGVEKLFHRVAQRPGKPFWFGRTKDQLVFAFPGNPVSSFVCFLKYFKPWFFHVQKIWQGEKRAILAEDFSFKPSLTYFLQVVTTSVQGEIQAAPVEGNGSGDLANLIDADGLLELPSEETVFKKGSRFPYIEF